MWLIAELWVPARTLQETWNSSFHQVRLSSAAVRDRAPQLTITQGTWPADRSLKLVKASKLTTWWARRAIWFLRRQTISLALWQQRPKIRIIGSLETLSSNSWPDLSHHKEMARLWIRHNNRFNNPTNCCDHMLRRGCQLHCSITKKINMTGTFLRQRCVYWLCLFFWLSKY